MSREPDRWIEFHDAETGDPVYVKRAAVITIARLQSGATRISLYSREEFVVKETLEDIMRYSNMLILRPANK